MTAVVRNLFRTTAPDAPSLGFEQQDDCPCGRGPVIGAVAVRAAGANDRVAFFPLGSVYARLPEVAADLCCLDCVTDTVSEMASGETNRQMQEITRQRQAALGGER
jgi:hypothetical protein